MLQIQTGKDPVRQKKKGIQMPWPDIYMQRQTLYRQTETIKNIQGKNREINSEINLEIIRDR